MSSAIFSVTSEQLTGWVTAFLFPFLRILALVASAPLLGDRSVPRQLKLVTALALAGVIAPTLPPPPAIPIVSAEGMWLVAQQALIGLAMGFSMRLVFATVHAAGEYIGLQMGLSFASFFDPMNAGSTTVVARLLHMLALLLFLALDGHLLVITALAQSFHALPVGAGALSGAGWLVLVRAGGDVIASGLLLALPLVTALLVLNLGMAVLNRASPQFSIFAIGFPLTLLAGIAMLQLLMPHLQAFLAPRFASGIAALLDLVVALRR